MKRDGSKWVGKPALYVCTGEIVVGYFFGHWFLFFCCFYNHDYVHFVCFPSTSNFSNSVSCILDRRKNFRSFFLGNFRISNHSISDGFYCYCCFGKMVASPWKGSETVCLIAHISWGKSQKDECKKCEKKVVEEEEEANNIHSITPSPSSVCAHKL